MQKVLRMASAFTRPSVSGEWGFLEEKHGNQRKSIKTCWMSQSPKFWQHGGSSKLIQPTLTRGLISRKSPFSPHIPQTGADPRNSRSLEGASGDDCDNTHGTLRTMELAPKCLSTRPPGLNCQSLKFTALKCMSSERWRWEWQQAVQPRWVTH